MSYKVVENQIKEDIVMGKTNNQKEYLFMKGISLKHNKYYTANKGLHTKEAILEAYRSNKMIIELDILLDKRKFIN